MNITPTPFRRTLGWLIFVTAVSVARASADVVTDWNAITLSVASGGNRPGPAIILDIAMAQIAVHDAVQAYQRRFDTYARFSDVAADSTFRHTLRPVR